MKFLSRIWQRTVQAMSRLTCDGCGKKYRVGDNPKGHWQRQEGATWRPKW